jgi:hypothetical protein
MYIKQYEGPQGSDLRKHYAVPSSRLAARAAGTRGRCGHRPAETHVDGLTSNVTLGGSDSRRRGGQPT